MREIIMLTDFWTGFTIQKLRSSEAGLGPQSCMARDLGACENLSSHQGVVIHT